MNFFDAFKPYSAERGDLEEYLREHNGMSADNLFHGPEYFFIIKEKGLIIPGSTSIRVDMSPAPDTMYFVNSDYQLESNGLGRYNMSCMGAEKGIYTPAIALKDKNWSIYF